MNCIDILLILKSRVLLCLIQCLNIQSDKGANYSVVADECFA